MKKIKLLTIIESLGKGGAERVLINILPELKKIDIDCEVAILFNIDDLASELEEKGIKVHRLNLSNKWNIFLARRKIQQLQIINKYDIVHAHLFFAHFHSAIAFLFDKKIKKIVTFHNLGFNEYPANTLLKKLRKKIEEYAVKTFDMKCSVSVAVKKHYSKHLQLNNVKVIYNSFPLNDFSKYKIEPKRYNNFTILTPGRLVEAKGHKYLLDAIKILNKEKININFLIYGDGPLREIIKNEIKEFDNVRLHNAIPHNKLMELFNNVDLIVIPSIYEAFGLVIGEAMIMGKPVIATKIDGIVELIDNNIEGILVEPRNSSDLSNAIKRMYLDIEFRNQCVKNAKEKIKKFDSESIAKKLMNVYRELLNEK